MSNKTLQVEWAPFTIKKEDFYTMLKASDRMQKDFLTQQAGFIGRQLLRKSDTEFTDLVLWETAEHAQKAMQAAQQSESCGSYFSLMQVDASQISHLDLVKEYH
jgi:heme-degrading monooxygenase HmoA